MPGNGRYPQIYDKSGCEVEENMAELIQLQKKCGEEKDFVGFLEADDQFHKVLFDVTGQEMAWETIASRNGHYNRLRILYVQRDTAMQESSSSIIRLQRFWNLVPGKRQPGRCLPMCGGWISTKRGLLHNIRTILSRKGNGAGKTG